MGTTVAALRGRVPQGAPPLRADLPERGGVVRRATGRTRGVDHTARWHRLWRRTRPALSDVPRLLWVCALRLPWILAINYHVVSSEWLRPEVDRYLASLAAEAIRLGYGRASSQWHLRRTLRYCYLRDPDRVLHLDEADLASFEEALRTFSERPDVVSFFGSADAYEKAVRSHMHGLFTLRTVLYHRDQLAAPPKKRGGRPSPLRVPRYIPADQLDRLMVAVRRLVCPYQRTALIVARWSGARRGESAISR